jgi:asparagine synthase (glutamine-hydrolysing)
MAAIAGVLRDETARDIVESMLEAMRHRGPQTETIKEEQSFVLGARSLSLSTARGNGFARDGGAIVLFDGEIYNERGGAEADADVVLRLYRKFGRAFAGELRGAFACAILDGNELILARDALGIRPLYWGHATQGALCFASEMKALVGVSDDVRELLPRTTWSSIHGLGGWVPKSPAVSVPPDPADAAAALRACVMHAVERRLADGAVGACLLSGGLDSSIIAAAVKALGADMPLMTVGVEGRSPDVANARIVAEHLRMRHEIRLFGRDEIARLVPDAVWHMESFDEDCVSGAISNLFASALAAKETHCILSGEGGDELFGGYHLLKDIPDEAGRLKMMERLTEIAYNTALQRLDRAMMANSIHYRTPFLDPEVMAFAAHLPVEWKIHRRDDGTLVEKWILREAFKGLLPEAIYQRPKLRFSVGTGTDSLMDEIAALHVSLAEAASQGQPTPEGYTLNSAKELWYYRIFKQRFPHPCFERLVGRWDPNK